MVYVDACSFYPCSLFHLVSTYFVLLDLLGKNVLTYFIYALLQTFENDSEMLAPDIYYHVACIQCKECGKKPDEDTNMIMAAKEQDDVFAAEILEPYCRFCYAKMFKTSAIKIAEFVEIAPEISYCI